MQYQRGGKTCDGSKKDPTQKHIGLVKVTNDSGGFSKIMLKELTSDMVLCTVQHICCMDELIARPSHPQFSFCVAKYYLPPAEKH